MASLFLDIAPLAERHHTGLAVVTKNLARQMLADEEVRTGFFINRQFVPNEVVAEFARESGGDLLWWAAGRCAFPLPDGLGPDAIGLYPAHKAHRRLFPREVLIVHDLTTVVTPEYHPPDTVRFWTSRLLGDILSSDLLVAVSDSTLLDIRTYYPQARHIPAIVSHEAPDPGSGTVRLGGRGPAVEPYIVILGTLEPRKNAEFVLEFLAENPEVLARAKFVFVGRWGWGDRTEDLVRRQRLQAAVAEGRIQFTGFLPDRVRDALLAFACGVIYPSRYEGFGLPILEAFQHGTPVITTAASSLPEVGGELAYYVDPDSTASLKGPVERCLAEGLARLGGGPPAEPAEARRAWARTFGWGQFYERIKRAALGLVEDQAPAPARRGREVLERGTG